MDAPRAGRQARGVHRVRDRIVRATVDETSPDGREWTTRSLARWLNVNHMAVHRVWKAYGIGCRHAEPNSPPMPRAAPRIEGMFLHPPHRAAIVRLDSTTRSRAPPEVPPPSDTDGTAAPGPGPLYWEPLTDLLRGWRESAATPSKAPYTAAELLVFLRMIDRRSDATSRFLVVHEGFPRSTGARVARWIRSHPRFETVGVRRGRTWIETVEACVQPRFGPRSPEPALEPVTASLSEYLAHNPSASAPFVWSPVASETGWAPTSVSAN